MRTEEKPYTGAGQRPWRAAGCMVGAQLAFVCLDAIMKVLVQTYPVGMLVTVRNFAQVLVLLGLAPPNRILNV
jgi:hypothetical protein